MGKVAKRVDDHVGERIRERRTMMGLTQEHLAKALDISYEHGGKNRSTIELVRNYSEIEEPAVRSAVSGLIKSLAGKERRRKSA